MSNFLEVKDLSVRFNTEDGVVQAVDKLSFSLEKGKTLGIVGESGSGKSVTSLAIMGLHKGSRAEVTGQILVEGQDVNAMSEAQVRKLRGKSMAMIFQDALAALHPYYTVGNQIAYQATVQIGGCGADFFVVSGDGRNLSAALSLLDGGGFDALRANFFQEVRIAQVTRARRTCVELFEDSEQHHADHQPNSNF